MLFEKITILDENFTVRENMYVGVEAEVITYVSEEAPDDETREVFGECYDGGGKVLMPGFYNGHGHSPMSLLRGYGEGLPLHRWLNEKVFPFEGQLKGEDVYWGTLLSMAESARFGIVSTSDMYFFNDDMVRAIVACGEKSNLCRAVTNFTGETPEANGTFREMREAVERHHGTDGGRILVDAGLHAEYTNDDRTARAVAEYAKAEGLRMHVHAAETEFETLGCRERHHGMSPVQYLDAMGLFDVPATAAHCVWLTDEDRAILKAKGVTVASNPVSNLKLVSGICEAAKLYELGIPVSIGTDGASSNNSMDFFEELKLFALLGKYRGGEASLMTPEQVLYSATRAGALSQGRDDCGLIREGFKADLIAIDLRQPNLQPMHNVMNSLVYAASGKDVCLTMIDGRMIYRDGEYTTVDIEKVCAEVNRAKDEILKRV